MTQRERIQDILKLPYINTGAIATEIYPDKPKQSARALFRNKLFEINGNRFNPCQSLYRIVLEEFGVDLTTFNN